jgi:hypothetical protein
MAQQYDEKVISSEDEAVAGHTVRVNAVHLITSILLTILQKGQDAGLMGLDVDTSNVNPSKTLRKMDFRLIPMLALLYLLSFLDRSNIGNAKVYPPKSHHPCLTRLTHSLDPGHERRPLPQRHRI